MDGADRRCGLLFLRRWLAWARRSQLPAFVDLHRKITAHRDAIDPALEHGLSNALVESTNTKIQLLTRIAFGFHGPEPRMALAMLSLGGHTPALPGRQRPTDVSGRRSDDNWGRHRPRPTQILTHRTHDGPNPTN